MLNSEKLKFIRMIEVFDCKYISRKLDITAIRFTYIDKTYLLVFEFNIENPLEYISFITREACDKQSATKTCIIYINFYFSSFLYASIYE